MKRLSLPAAFGVVLALLFAGLGGAPAFAGSNPVPIYLKADPCPGASLCGNFLTGQFKGSGKRTTQFAALPNLTVTRASFAYGENADGSLKGFQAGQARVTSRGLGAFEATTTLNLWSQDFTNAAWSTFAGAAKVGAAPVADPAGGSTAYEVSFGSTGGTLGSASAIFQSVTMSANTTYSGCFYVRAKTGSTTIRVSITDNASVTNGTGDTLVTTAWSRICTTQTISASPAGNNLALRNNTAGTSANVYVAFADFRAGSYSVPYCPTTASTATCAADNISITGLTFPASMSLFASVDAPTTPTASDRYVITAGTVGPALTLKNTVNQLAAAVPSVGYVGSTGDRGGSSITYAAANFAQATQSAYVNGALAIGTLSWTPSGSTLWLGQNAGGGASVLNGYLRGFAYYPTQLSGGAAQALTVQGDSSSLSLNFASGLYKTTTPYVRTNLVLQSQNFANASWAKTAASAPISATVAAPDGTFTASKLTEDGTTAQHRAVQAVAHTSGVATTFSVYLKAGERTWAFLQQDGVPTGQYFDLINGIAGNSTGTASTARITSAGNGWWRASLTYTPAATGSPGVYVMTATANGTSNYAGDGSSGVYVWGAQVEASPTPTSYIATTAAAASAATTQSVNPADIAALTFTNASGGYAQFSNGTLQWFPANAPRCTDQGCLIEEAATNLETYSQDSSQWTPTNVVVTTGQLAPDGTATAFQVSSTANLNSFVASPIITLANNTTYTSSLYFKPVSGTGVIAIEYTTGTTLVGPTCNALTGSTTNGAVITTYGNGWSRCTVTFTTAATGTPSARVAYVGAYGATATPTTVLLWQKDIVAKAFATSPIPTTSASATRSADVMSYAYTPPTTGTLATSWSAPITPADQFPAFLSDGTLNNRVHFAQSATTGNLNAVVNNGGAVTSFSTANVVTGSGVACGALSYTGGAQIASLNGGTNATAAGATIPTTLSTLTVGGGGAATAARQLNGYVRDVAVFAYAANSNETPYRAACNF